MPFPLPFIPNVSYKTGGRKFGAPRDGGVRKHAGCDLIAPHLTEILAIDDGYVVAPWKKFYRGTCQLAIRHTAGVIRYCEIEEEDLAKSLREGDAVKAGQVIAYVGKMYRDSMLHFEFYTATVAGEFTVRSNPGFQRRGDLIDPAPLLDKLARDLRPGAAQSQGVAASMQAMIGRAPG